MTTDPATIKTLLDKADMASVNVLGLWALMTPDEQRQYRADSEKWMHNWRLAAAVLKRHPGRPPEWWVEFNAKHEARRAKLLERVRTRSL